MIRDASAAVKTRAKESRKAYLYGNQFGYLKRCQTLSSGESHIESIRSAISAPEAMRRLAGTPRRKKYAAASSVTTVPLKK